MNYTPVLLYTVEVVEDINHFHINRLIFFFINYILSGLLVLLCKQPFVYGKDIIYRYIQSTLYIIARKRNRSKGLEIIDVLLLYTSQMLNVYYKLY